MSSPRLVGAVYDAPTPVPAYTGRPRWYFPLLAAAWITIALAFTFHEITTALNSRWRLTADGVAMLDGRTGRLCIVNDRCYTPEQPDPAPIVRRP